MPAKKIPFDPSCVYMLYTLAVWEAVYSEASDKFIVC